MQEVLYLGAAYIAGLLANRLSFPPLVGYLIVGYVLHAFDVEATPTLTHLADIGIELLLFSVGLKLKFNSLMRREVLSVGSLHLAIVAVVSGAIFFVLGERITGSLILGLSLAFSSTVLAIKVLEDNGELSSLHGRDVVSILILQDIVAIGLLAVADDKQPTPWAFLLLLMPLLRPVAHYLLHISRTEELTLLLGVSLALAGGFLAETAAISPDIGALLAGMMLASHTKTDELAKQLWGLKEMFLVAFFLQIGLSALPGQQEIILALELLLFMPLQGGLFFILFVDAGLRARTAFVSSLALTTYSEFALITTHAMVDNGLLTPDWKATIGLAVAGSLAISAPLNRYSHQLFDWLEPFLLRFEKKSGNLDKHDRLPDSIGVAEWLIMGMGQTGTAAYLSLRQQKKRVLGLDADNTVLEKMLDQGLRVIYGDAGDNELWKHLPLARVKGIILTIPEFEVRSATVQQLRRKGFQGKIGAICYYDNEKQELERLGADFVIHPLMEAGHQLARNIIS